MDGVVMPRKGTVVDGGVWKRSSRSTPNGNCVELRRGPEMISVRDSKNVDSEVLTFTRDRWICFLGCVVR